MRRPCQTKNRNRRSIGAARFLILLACAIHSHAEKYALLIGINRYAPERGASNLEGPVNDATALRQALVSSWQFKPENVKTLFDMQATKSRILDALDSYATSLKPGDFLFLFYSGHGTSWFAEGMPQTGIASDTGALVSSDLKLIVGNSDLQPRLRQLDGIVQVFAIFDSCYSGNSIKSLAIATPKYLSSDLFRNIPTGGMAQYDRQFSDFDRFTSASSQYPYRRVLYLSAASKAEQAVDIPKLMISQGFHTVDGLPHGALTDAVLRGLRGQADTNHDGRISYEELYEFARKTVTREFSQTPQFLFPADDPRMAQTPVFSVANAPAVPTIPPPAPRAVRVKLEGSAGSLRAEIESIPGVAISNNLFDLLVRSGAAGFELYHQSGTLIQKYPMAERASLLHRIQVEPQVRKLIDLTYKKQEFNASLSIVPDGNGFYKLGDRLRFRAKAEQDCYPLLLDIDVSGAVTVVFPVDRAQVTKVTGGAEIWLGGESHVTAPTGMEYLKLFVFRDKPVGLDEFIAEAKGAFAPATAEFAKLMRIVEPDLPGRAATQVKLVTTE